jgi:dihydrofolate reductase
MLPRNTRLDIVFVVAVSENGVIGRGGALPWRLKSDLKRFRKLTWGHPVIMGRKTYASIRKPLDGRTNIVVSRDRSFAVPGVLVAASLEAALAAARGDALRRSVAAIMVIGGADIYAQVMDRATRLEITRVHARPAGDVMFPAIDPAVWREVARSEHPAGPDDEAGFTILSYERTPSGAEERPGVPVR